MNKEEILTILKQEPAADVKTIFTKELEKTCADSNEVNLHLSEIMKLINYSDGREDLADYIARYFQRLERLRDNQ